MDINQVVGVVGLVFGFLGLVVGVLSVVFGVLSVVFGVTSLVYAFMTNRRMGDRDALVKAQLCRFAGDIDMISTSAGWANDHFVGIRESAVKLDRNQDVHEILRRAQLGVGDSVAAHRMTREFLNDILALQEGLFHTKDITHVDRLEKDLSSLSGDAV